MIVFFIFFSIIPVYPQYNPNLGPVARAGLAAAPLAHPALVTWDVFSGFEDPDLSSLIESGQKWVPIVQMMFLYEARARASYRNISCTIGTPFWLDWEQKRSKTQGKPSKMTLDMGLYAG